jgi:hypothetical protein
MLRNVRPGAIKVQSLSLIRFQICTSLHCAPPLPDMIPYVSVVAHTFLFIFFDFEFRLTHHSSIPEQEKGGGVDRYAIGTLYSARIEICALHCLRTYSILDHVYTIGFPLRF